MSHKTTYRLITLIAIVAIFLTGCGGGKKALKDQVIGKWECTGSALTGDTTTTLTFDFKKDGKAQISTSGITLDITYKWLTDTQMEITMSFMGESQTLTPEVAVNGNKMNLTVEGTNAECTKK